MDESVIIPGCTHINQSAQFLNRQVAEKIEDIIWHYSDACLPHVVRPGNEFLIQRETFAGDSLGTGMCLIFASIKWKTSWYNTSISAPTVMIKACCSLLSRSKTAFDIINGSSMNQ